MTTYPTTSSVLDSYSREEIAALRDIISPSTHRLTDDEYMVFIATARRLNLDPFARQIVPIYTGGHMVSQTTIDGFRLIAARTKKYRGQVGPFWCGPDGIWKEVWLEKGPPAAAKVGIRHADFPEITWGVATFKSYAKGGTWNSMSDVMTAKVAEALGFRKTFPEDLSGLYTEDEMMQALDTEDTAAAVVTRRKFPDPVVASMSNASVVAAAPTPSEDKTPKPPVFGAPVTKKQKSLPNGVSQDTYDKLVGLIQEDQDAFKEILRKHYPQYNSTDRTFGANMTPEDAQSVLDHYDEYIDEYLADKAEQDKAAFEAARLAAEATIAVVVTPEQEKSEKVVAEVVEDLDALSREELYNLFVIRSKAASTVEGDNESTKEHTRTLLAILQRGVKPWKAVEGGRVKDIYDDDDLKKALRIIARYDTKRTPADNQVELIPEEIVQIA